MTLPFWSLWYFQIPNYLLATLVYTLLGRFVLSLFVPPDWDNYIWRAFRLLTDPIVAAVGWLTPRAVPWMLLPLAAALWLSCLRVVLALSLIDPTALQPAASPQ